MEGGNPTRFNNFGFTCRNCSPSCYQVEKELTMAGDNDKHTIWALLLSLR